jgi:hypothetical protein
MRLVARLGVLVRMQVYLAEIFYCVYVSSRDSDSVGGGCPSSIYAMTPRAYAPACSPTSNRQAGERLA